MRDHLKGREGEVILPQMAIVCAVGENLRLDATLFGRAITALDRIPLRLVSQAASRRNITFVLRDADVPAAMTRLHDTFFNSQVSRLKAQERVEH